MAEEQVQSAAALPSVAALVATRQRRSSLGGCLRALLSQSDLAQLVVVDDGSEDGTFEFAVEVSREDRRVVAERIEHAGKAAALQVGLTRVSSDVVLLIDDDVIAGPGLVRGHAEHHRRRADLVVVGYMPCLLRQRHSGDPFLSDIYAREYEAHCRHIEARPELVLRNLWGGNVSLRVEHCEALGFSGWNLGHEDQDFGLRCLRHGLTGVFDRELYAEHRHEREMAAFLRAARAQGVARYYLHERYDDLVQPLPPSHALEGLDPLSSALVRGLGRQSLYRPAEWLLTRAARVATMSGLSTASGNIKRLARRIALQSGLSLAQAVGADAGPEYRLEQLERMAKRRAGR